MKSIRVYHSRRRTITCPQCNGLAKEVECFDVGMHAIICNQCGALLD